LHKSRCSPPLIPLAVRASLHHPYLKEKLALKP
jgi:hypothetical protein